MGTRSGLQYAQFPGLRPTSSVSCQAQISHSASGHMQLKSPSGRASCCSRAPYESSCLPFLTSPRLFTQPNCPTGLETSQVRVPHGQTPPFSRCCLAPQFLWCWRPQSQRVCTSSVCLPLRLYSPQRLPAPRSLLVPGCPPCSGRGGSW